MKNNKCLFLVIFISYSIFSMEDPKEIPANEPGIFLENIVSEYKNPIRISLMPIQRSLSRRDGFEIDGDRDYERAEHLAVVFNNQVQWSKRTIKTREESEPSYKELNAKVYQIACLRIEDLLKNGGGNKTYVWLHKFLKNYRNTDNNQRGYLTTSFNRVEEFNFDFVRPSQTLVTLKLNHKDRLDSRIIDVESKTTPRLDLTYDYNPPSGGPF